MSSLVFLFFPYSQECFEAFALRLQLPAMGQPMQRRPFFFSLYIYTIAPLTIAISITDMMMSAINPFMAKV